MPELPEVETIASNLRRGGEGVPSLIGCRVKGAQALWSRTLANITPQQFDRRIRGQEVCAIRRRGKFLIFDLSTDCLLIHLRMSGDLLVEPGSTPLEVHHRLLLEFDNGWRLAFNDTRKFGRVWLTNQPESVLEALGPEPLDRAYTPDDFYRHLGRRKRQIKPLLLDQSFLAGMGNIYVDESLNLARIHPLKPADQLTRAEADRLLVSLRQVLEEGIRRQGASIDWVYRGGDFQNYFRVYQRTGLPCPRCGTPVERIIVGQRGTHFCPHCQPPP